MKFITIFIVLFGFNLALAASEDSHLASAPGATDYPVESDVTFYCSNRGNENLVFTPHQSTLSAYLVYSVGETRAFRGRVAPVYIKSVVLESSDNSIKEGFLELPVPLPPKGSAFATNFGESLVRFELDEKTGDIRSLEGDGIEETPVACNRLSSESPTDSDKFICTNRSRDLTVIYSPRSPSEPETLTYHRGNLNGVFGGADGPQSYRAAIFPVVNKKGMVILPVSDTNGRAFTAGLLTPGKKQTLSIKCKPMEKPIILGHGDLVVPKDKPVIKK